LTALFAAALKKTLERNGSVLLSIFRTGTCLGQAGSQVV